MYDKENNLDLMSEGGEALASNKSGLLDRVLTRRYKLILLMGVVGLGVSFIYAIAVPDKYHVYSRIFVEKSSPKLIDEKKEKMADSRNFLNAQAEVIQSMPILSVIMSDDAIVNSMRQSGVVDPLEYLRNEIEVSVGKNDDIITVGGYSSEPLWLTNVINSMVDAYILHNSILSSNTSSEVIDVLQKKKQANELTLKAKRAKLFDLARSNGAITLAEGDNIELARLAKISEALTVAELELTEIQTLYDTVNALAGKPGQVRAMALTDAAFSDTEDARLRREIQTIDEQLSELQQKATGQHPAVYSVMEKKALLNRQLQENTARIAKEYRENIIQRWMTCSKKVQQQRMKLDEQKAIAWNTNTEAAEYEYLKKEITRLENSNDTLERRINEESLSANSSSMNITILERAEPLSFEIKTGKTVIVVNGFFIGLFIGLLAGIAVELSDQSVRILNDVRSTTSLQVLSSIPHMPARDGIRKLGLKSQIDAASQASEAFREIWSHLYYQGSKQNKSVVMITSPEPGEGKSIIASNIAITMAHSGIKVLLVDADFRSPVQQKIHDSKLSRRYGLATVLERGIDYLPQCIEITSVNGLELLNAGPSSSIHSDLLAGPDFPKILEALKMSYDRIVIDTPPVLSVADARILAGFCDSTIMVVRADQSGREQCVIATDLLRSVGAEILGVVFNDTVLSKNRYSYGIKSYGCRKSVIESINKVVKKHGQESSLT